MKPLKGASKNLEFAQMQGAEKISPRRIWVYVSKKFFSQRSSWDEMWIFRGALKLLSKA
jgi:hypothetical protein